MKQTKDVLKDFAEAIGAFVGGLLAPFMGAFASGTTIVVKTTTFPIFNVIGSIIIGFVAFQVIEMLHPGALQPVTDAVKKAEQTAGRRANYMPRAVISFLLAFFAGPLVAAIEGKIGGIFG